MTNTAKVVTALCPECETNIRFDKAPHLGKLVTCPECGTTLEVVRQSPIKLDWAFEDPIDDFDYDYDDEDFDDLDDDDEDFDDLDDLDDDEDWD